MDHSDIKNLIKDLIEKVNIPVKSITIGGEEPSSFKSGDTTWISVEVEEPHHFHNFGGEALHALNHIVRRIIEGKNSEDKERKNSILIDINGFQKKRVESIHTIAHMMAERARYFKSSVEVDPMSAFERRIVHEFLSNESDIATESTGEGRSRRVVIKYTGGI